MRMERAAALAGFMGVMCCALSANAESSFSSHFAHDAHSVTARQLPSTLHAAPSLLPVTPAVAPAVKGRMLEGSSYEPVAEPQTVPGPVQATGTQVVADVLKRIGSLQQFLSATLIPARKEVVATGDGVPVTAITPSLRISPTFAGRTWGIAAVATF